MLWPTEPEKQPDLHAFPLSVFISSCDKIPQAYPDESRLQDLANEVPSHRVCYLWLGILDKPKDSERNYRVNACDSGMIHSLGETLSTLKGATKHLKSWWPLFAFPLLQLTVCDVHVCAVVCASVWRLEGNPRYHPLSLRQVLLLAFNSIIRLDWLTSEPRILLSVSPELGL